MKAKLFADGHNIDCYVIPTIAFDYNHWVSSHKSFILSLRWWKWQIGFSIFWHFMDFRHVNDNLMQDKGDRLHSYVDAHKLPHLSKK